MLLQVAGALGAAELADLRVLATHARFVDGRVTSGASLHDIKRNEQVAHDDPAMPEITRIVLAALKRTSTAPGATTHSGTRRARTSCMA